MSKILEIKNLTKKYKDFTLDNISFSLDRGYIMGFIGENGAGKTTTIKLIMNLVKKNSGEIKVFGKDNEKFEREIKENIGFVYDDCFFYENLNLEDNAKIISAFYKKWSFDDFYRYLKRFNLNKNKKVSELSKGMKMKFALAIALSHKAEFIIMDEPTAGLDPIVRREVLDILQDIIQDEKIGILLSTHVTADLERIADYITYINNGKIVFSKSKDEVLEEYKIVKGSKEVLEIAKENCISIRKNSFGFEGLSIKSQELKGILQDKIIIEPAALEDIMIFISRYREE